MIKDATALRHGAVPQDLYHRDGQIDHISSILDPSSFEWAEDVCIFGPSGAGKTTIAKYVLRELEREILDIRWGYVNCMADNTAASAIYKLVRDLGLGADLREGVSTSRMLDRLKQFDGQIVAVLDEVYSVEERAVLALETVPNVSLVAITIDQDEWFTALSAQAKSRMQCAATVRLEKYHHHELVDILNSRVSHGLRTSRVDSEAVEYIADLAAGNARKAIATLRHAAVHVGDGHTEQLDVSVVEAISDDVDGELRDRNVRSLGSHHRLLLRLIENAGSIDAGTLHARYDDSAQDPKSRSTRHRYLNDLQYRDLVEIDGDGRGSTYHALRK
ncbi:AAA family ATPase [Halomicroarcula limicola]|uniref:AAA family ATPase n=1 Tax=Haloarcula limicola TaxID=1429915 RepID=A0A8J7YD40_9EURY|nr:AAA family ATPase [Halomicroarcula limicola]MBV0925026.1 AAA family ATPase [Halomicroarcula limicola]